MQMNLLVVSRQDAAPAWSTITPQAYKLTHCTANVHVVFARVSKALPSF